MTRRKNTVVRGSGNVFADLNLPDAEDRLAKARLAHLISELIRERGLTQTAAAEILEVDQPKISALTRGRLADFSTERLMRFLTLLGRDIQIVVRSTAKGNGTVTVVDAASSPSSSLALKTARATARQTAEGMRELLLIYDRWQDARKRGGSTLAEARREAAARRRPEQKPRRRVG